MTFCIARLI